MSKALLIMKDIICKYHPDFVKNRSLKRFATTKPQFFRTESLVEVALATVGGYTFLDAEGYDFSDFSDSKTTSVNQNTGAVVINSVETKVGALRIIAYNPISNNLDFMFVPQSELDYVRSPCYGKSQEKERIQFTYSKNSDSYGWFEKYRVDSFVDLATMKG